MPDRDEVRELEAAFEMTRRRVAPYTAPEAAAPSWRHAKFADVVVCGAAHLLGLENAAIDRVLARRPGIGKAYLFPSPRRPDQPVSKDLASAWLEHAEALAQVPKQEGSLWHAYRRKWATELKHLPDVDVAQAGGWSDLSSLKTAYQHADDATLYRVVSQPAELREAHA